MSLIKRLLFFILIIVILATGIYWASQNNYLQNASLNKIAKFFTDNKILEKMPWTKNQENSQWQKISSDIQDQSKILSERAKKTSSHVRQVLGTNIEVNKQKKQPVHQKAFDYGRYLYCKAVVEEWEEANLGQE